MHRYWQIISLALLMDHLFGDPPSRYHPVAWMGNWISLIRRRCPATGSGGKFIYGALAVIVSSALLGLLGRIVQRRLRRLQPLWHLFALAGLLSLLLSLRGLVEAGRVVANSLDHNDLDNARQQLAWHLVSRQTVALDENQIAAATIESLAENVSDSVIAPLFWYAATGLPGVFIYRFLNTADAMLGYRDSDREWLGKTAARLDDVVNWIPARLSALLLIGASCLASGSPCQGWRIWRRDAGKTLSPNAGHPMSATAGALGVELEKVGHYRLGAGLRLPVTGDIYRAVILIRRAIWLPILAVGLSGHAIALHCVPYQKE